MAADSAKFSSSVREEDWPYGVRFMKLFKNDWFEKSVIVLQVLFLICLGAIYLRYRFYWSPDSLFLVLAFFFFLSGKFEGFVRDWFPIVLMILSYEALRGVADDLGPKARVEEVINWELAIFRCIPTLKLQTLIYSLPNTGMFIYLAALAHSSHFFIPFLWLLWLWQNKRTEFKKFSAVLLLVSYMGFLTFLLLPVAPPWLAEEWGFLTGVKRMLLDASETGFAPLYLLFSPNPVAAMPSLHAAYPTVVALSFVSVFGAKGLWIAFYPPLIWLTSVYSGEHYVVDVLGGILYAVVAHLVVSLAERRFSLLGKGARVL